MQIQALRPDAVCARLAASQYGCISLHQAVAAGLSEASVFRLCKRGVWKRALPGVYVIAGAGPSWHQRLMAAQLWLGDGCAVSHEAAAALWSLPGFPAGPVEFSTSRERRSRYGVAVHRVQSLGSHEIGKRGPLLVTSPTRMLIDISGTADHEAFEVAFHYGLYKKITSLTRLRWLESQRRRSGSRGAPLLREMLELYSDCDRPPESPLEIRVRRLLKRAKLPPPERQHEVVAYGKTYRIDLAYPAARVAIEVDGYRWHSSRLSWEGDKVKIAALQATGWNVIHATYELATQRQGVLLDAVNRALGACLLEIDGL